MTGSAGYDGVGCSFTKTCKRDGPFDCRPHEQRHLRDTSRSDSSADIIEQEVCKSKVTARSRGLRSSDLSCPDQFNPTEFNDVNNTVLSGGTSPPPQLFTVRHPAANELAYIKHGPHLSQSYLQHPSQLFLPTTQPTHHVRNHQQSQGRRLWRQA